MRFPTALLRFRLRTLMLLVTLLSIWLGLVTARARRQQAAVDAIRKLGGTVYYDYQLKKAGTVVPIRVRGTREHPKVGVDVMKALTPK